MFVQEVDKDNSKANTGPEGDEEAQYEELGPAFGHVSQANQNASSSPKVQQRREWFNNLLQYSTYLSMAYHSHCFHFVFVSTILCVWDIFLFSNLYI